MKIWKYPIEIQDVVEIYMPKEAQILCVQIQPKYGLAMMWVLCEPGSELVNRRFAVYGTGHIIPDVPKEYVGTFQVEYGALVFHVFELL